MLPEGAGLDDQRPSLQHVSAHLNARRRRRQASQPGCVKWTARRVGFAAGEIRRAARYKREDGYGLALKLPVSADGGAMGAHDRSQA